MSFLSPTLSPWRLAIALLLGLLMFSAAQARISVYEFETPEQEADYNALIEEMRCLVCQNQNIADSNAELAQDMKRKTYEMVIEGKSKKEIANYMTERYGDFVLYRPPVTSATLFLWVGPFIILFIGLFVLIRIIRSRRAVSRDNVLSDEEKARAEKLLKGD